MTKQTLGIVAVGLALSTPACLQKVTTHTIYLTPDGAVSWMAIEADVRSDEGDRAQRTREEQAYLTEALTGTHGVARGLETLIPRRVDTTVLRRERPFLVVTEGAFDRVDETIERLLAALGVQGDVSLDREGLRSRLVVRVDLRNLSDSDDDIERPVTALFEEPDRYRIVLTDGRFVEATGFTMADSGMTATFVDQSYEDIMSRGGVLALSLTWDRPASTSGPRTSSDRSSR